MPELLEHKHASQPAGIAHDGSGQAGMDPSVDGAASLLEREFDLGQWSQAKSYLACKRCLDIIGALVGIVVLGPIVLVSMVLVWIEDGGPVIFRQLRVGKDGRTFSMIKIRTMVKDAEALRGEIDDLNVHADNRTFKVINDPRILKVGAILRRFSIDEFPQVINVLRGEMSLVGPRPPLPREVDLYSPQDHVRFVVKPGLTCYWQIAGRGQIAFQGQVALDRRYIQEHSIWIDLVIISKTVPAMLRGDGAH